ncbi:MAG: hypothetical protein KatS3mg131_1730 [Candidatus Tectimicrobiota bacterium]|nr:MAG: hypothetical protein KatS3mg131_1730 [Candidatus Tectomicrobia bacterium]
MKRLLLSMIVVVLWSAAAWAQVRAFPPAPPLRSPIEGAIDFHVHSAPDVFGRNLDDIDVARAAAREGMRAIVLKNHITSTADRAALVQRLVPEIEVFGGIVLNQAVGGINPAAVEWMFRMAGGRGKVVWLPTFDADHHLKTFHQPGEGIRVARDGKVLPETEEVLKVIARENLVLHTGHVSPEETLLVLRRAKELGVKRMAVTHAMADVPGLSLEQMKQAAELGAYLELVFLNHLMGPHAHLGWMRHWKQVSIADMAKAIKAVGAAHFILSSDLGQTGNPIHSDGYKMLVLGLKQEGISQEELDLMMRVNPATLLGLED